MIKFTDCSHKIVNLPLLVPVSHASYSRSANQVIRISLKDSNANHHRTDILLRDYVNEANLEASLDFLYDFFRTRIRSNHWRLDFECVDGKSETETILNTFWKQEDVQNHLSVFSAFDLIIRESNKRFSKTGKPLKANLKGLWVIPLLKENIFAHALKIAARFNLPLKLKMPIYRNISHSWMSILREFQQVIHVVDFNATWSIDEATKFIAEFPFMKQFVWEQCFPKDMAVEKHLHFHQSTGIEMMLDESLCRLRDVELYIKAMQGVHMSKQQFWNLRLAKNGGVTGVNYIFSEAKKNGVLCHLGCFVGEGRLLRKYQIKTNQTLAFRSYDKNPWWLSPFGI